MSTTTPAVTPPTPPAAEPGGENGTPGRFAFVEALLDNLSAWTAIAAAIGLLYLVWATLEILSRYLGPVPSVTP